MPVHSLEGAVFLLPMMFLSLELREMPNLCGWMNGCLKLLVFDSQIDRWYLVTYR